MHPSSMRNMQKFKDKYLPDFVGSVLDVGSLDVNGTYRPIFEGWKYKGLDLVSGKGVDTTSWARLRKESFDCVISGQTLEHTEDDFDLIKKIDRVLKPGGFCCLIAPSQGKLHHLPDYRRYTKPMMMDLCNSVDWDMVDCYIDPEKKWCDCVLVAKKL